MLIMKIGMQAASLKGSNDDQTIPVKVTNPILTLRLTVTRTARDNLIKTVNRTIVSVS